ncbi:hypothetical protein EMCRGX_G023795 [Ephydatia muelleri]
MGVIDRLREDFYQRVCVEHVLIISALDVDALCACKILQALFKADDVPYTTVPVQGKADLQKAFSGHSEQVKVVVLINCGATLDVQELLQPEQDVRIYIVDSHRPVNLDNVYNKDQVNILLRDGDVLEVPPFDDIYASDMESEEDDDPEYFSDEDSAPSSKRRKGDESSYEARKRKHIWKRKREEILYKYTEYSYHGTASSLVAFDLAWKLSKDNNELLWWAIVGLTEQLLYEKIDRERYVSDMYTLQPHVLRLNKSNDDVPPSSINSMRIVFDTEMRLIQYRFWTIYDSLCNSEYTACKFKLWTNKGHTRLLELLADMGLPLVQSKQKFASMEVQYRDKIKEWIDHTSKKYGLDDIMYNTFVAQYGYKNKVCAADMVLCCSAIIERQEASHSESFLEALEVLSKNNLQRLHQGVELSKQQQMAIVAQVKNFIDLHQVVCTGPFIYAYVEEGMPHSKGFSKPMLLCKLARFLREAWLSMNKRARGLPFILSAPLGDSQGNCIVVGVPPHSDDTRKSEFARAFLHASDRIQARASFDHFDGSVMMISTEDRGRFFDALTALSAV